MGAVGGAWERLSKRSRTAVVAGSVVAPLMVSALVGGPDSAGSIILPAVGFIAALVAILVVSTALHEAGHVAGALVTGIAIERVALFGGGWRRVWRLDVGVHLLSRPSAVLLSNPAEALAGFRAFVVYTAGPAVNVALVGAVIASGLANPWSEANRGGPNSYVLAIVFLFTNAILAIESLVPAVDARSGLPSDGSQMLRLVRRQGVRLMLDPFTQPLWVTPESVAAAVAAGQVSLEERADHAALLLCAGHVEAGRELATETLPLIGEGAPRASLLNTLASAAVITDGPAGLPQARALIDESLAIEPGSAATRDTAALITALAGQPAEAVAILDEIVAEDWRMGPSTSATRAVALHLLGDEAGAADAFEGAEVGCPDRSLVDFARAFLGRPPPKEPNVLEERVPTVVAVAVVAGTVIGLGMILILEYGT